MRKEVRGVLVCLDVAANTTDRNRQGTQGQYDGASNSTLDNEFGTHVDDEVIKKILESGNLLESEVSSSPRSTRETPELYHDISYLSTVEHIGRTANAYSSMDSSPSAATLRTMPSKARSSAASPARDKVPYASFPMHVGGFLVELPAGNWCTFHLKRGRGKGGGRPLLVGHNALQSACVIMDM